MNSPDRPLLIGVLGPTGSGKTSLAEGIADELDAALINCDAFQVYRGMDIGTAKPVRKHRYDLLDIKNPDESYGLGEFCSLAASLLERYWSSNKSVVVVGGTGLYLRGLFEEYSGLNDSPPPAVREQLQNDLALHGLAAMVDRLKRLDAAQGAGIDLNNPVRVTRALERMLDPRPKISLKLPAFQKLKLGLSVTNDELWPRIEDRVHSMVQNGWVKEVTSLLENNFGPESPGFRAIGYTPIARAILKQTGLEEAISTTIVETRQYAKRQRTWLRSEPGLIKIDSFGESALEHALVEVRRLN